MFRKALIGLLLATIIPTIICFVSFRIYKVNREANAVNLLQTVQDFRANEIIPGLYLGDYESSLQFKHLDQNKISHVVAVLNSVLLPPALDYSQNYTYLVIKAEDRPTQNLIDTFPFVYDFIKNATQHNGTVLVHCAKGVSRSSALVIAYLMKDLEISFEDAYALVRKARPIVLPNKGFINQLQQYNKFQKISEKMVEAEEVEEKKEEEKKEERQETNLPPKVEEIKEMKEEIKEEVKEIDVTGTSPAIYQCVKGECEYLHGNFATDFVADVSLGVRYVIQQFINYVKK